MGDTSLLLPKGITSINDLPFPLHAAILRALTFLSFEELPSDERPPKNIWMNGKALRDHFKAVTKRRDQKYNPDGNTAIEDVPIDGPVERNAMIDELLIG